MSQIEILSSFDGDGKALTAAELIERAGLPRSSVFRSLKSLIASGFIHQDPVSKRYVLGPRVLQLGIIARRQLSGEEFIVEPLLRLLHRIGETITFSLVDVPSRTCVYVLEGPSDLRHVVQVGARYPLHLGAAGKVILAYLPAAVAAGVLNCQGLSKAEGSEIEKELESIRRNGFAITTGERVAGASSVAAPVFVGDSIYGSVAVAGPTDRALRVMLDNRAFVIETAKTLSARLSERYGPVKPATSGRHSLSSRGSTKSLRVKSAH